MWRRFDLIAIRVLFLRFRGFVRIAPQAFTRQRMRLARPPVRTVRAARPTPTQLSMDTRKRSEAINRDRRRLLGAAVLSPAGTQLGRIWSRRSAVAHSKGRKRAGNRAGNAQLVRLAEADRCRRAQRRLRRGRPGNGPPVILLHGWPYDIHSYVDVAPLLAAAGYRVIVPYLRGYGTTRFLSDETPRNGQQSALAVDVIALMDALKIEKAMLGGFDWGARTANIVAALWPERCKAMVSVSGYLIGSQAGRQDAAAAEGRAAMVVPVLFRHGARPRRLRQVPRDFAKLIWQTRFAEMEIRRRHVRSQRGGLRQPGPRRHRDPQLPLAARPGRRASAKYDDLEKRLAAAPVIAVPTITLEGDANGAPHPDPAAYAKKFSGKYEHRLITGGIGHNLPQEAPQAFAQAIVDVESQLMPREPARRGIGRSAARISRR